MIRFFLICFLASNLLVFSQKNIVLNNTKAEIVYDKVDSLAQPVVGLKSFKNDVLQHFIKLNADIKTDLIIALKVKFVVDAFGKLSKFEIVSQLPADKNYGKELVSFLSETPNWKPAVLYSKSVASNYLFSIKFQISSSKSKSNATVSIIKPEPVEGFDAFYEKLYTSIKIPYLEAVGTYAIKIAFMVLEDGSLTNFSVLEENPKQIGLATEVISVLKTFPKWKPATAQNYITLPLSVTLEAGKVVPYTKKNK